MKALSTLAAALLLSACATTHPIQPKLASPAVDFAQANTVEVRLSSFRFTPESITLEAGKPVALHIVDTASGGHDFTAPEFFAAAQIAREDAATVTEGQVELHGGQSATVHLVPAAGTYKLTCTHFGHDALGMSGTIIVK